MLAFRECSSRTAQKDRPLITSSKESRISRCASAKQATMAAPPESSGSWVALYVCTIKLTSAKSKNGWILGFAEKIGSYSSSKPSGGGLVAWSLHFVQGRIRVGLLQRPRGTVPQGQRSWKGRNSKHGRRPCRWAESENRPAYLLVFVGKAKKVQSRRSW